MQAPSSQTEILRASLCLCCPPIFCALITRALKQGLPLALSLLLINQVFSAMMGQTQPNRSLDTCKHLENPELQYEQLEMKREPNAQLEA